MKFDIKYNKDDNKIYIKSDYREKISIIVYNWDTTFDSISLLYELSIIFDDKLFFFEVPNTYLYDLNGIKIEIRNFEKNENIFEEFIRFRDRYGYIIKKIALRILSKTGFGDTLTCTPIIRKLSEIYNQRITIFTHMPEVFINNPYIDEIININNTIDYSIYSDYNIIQIFDTNHVNYARVDLRQNSAFNAGFQLKENELKMDFFPDDYIDIPLLPKRYICINPSITYTDRTWSFENWQKFINLIEEYIPVVAIGKITYYDNVCPKTFHPIKIKNGLNLLNNKISNTLSQMFHIINKCETFVTMANGLHLLSLCSDIHITQLACPWDTNWYNTRNGIKNYKLDYLIGDCDVHCTSNLKMSVNEHSNHMRVLNVHHNTIFSQEVQELCKDRWWMKDQCYLNKNYDCHPTAEQVFDSVLRLIKNK